MSALVAAVSLVIVASLFLLWRNNRVHDFRADLIKRCSAAAQQDIASGNLDWQWRYAAFESVSYNRMVLSLRPLRPECFYADPSFLTSRQEATS